MKEAKTGMVFSPALNDPYWVVPPGRGELLGEADPNGISQHAPGAKLDAGKRRDWLMLAGFSRALKAVAEVTTYGAKKYTPNGWKEVPDGETRYLDALARHLLADAGGEELDKETGLPHLAHASWNILAVLELREKNRS